MGLDMYLTKKKHLGNAKLNLKVLDNEYEWYKNKGKTYSLDNCTCIVQEVGYWRKANAIHKWFVDNVQEGNDDCKEYWVSPNKLEELLDTCKKVKETAKIEMGKVVVCQRYNADTKQFEKEYEDGEIITNVEEIEKILPTTDGFFFGNTDYDKWYMQDIYYTIEMLEKVLLEEEKESKQENNSYYYTSSW